MEKKHGYPVEEFEELKKQGLLYFDISIVEDEFGYVAKTRDVVKAINDSAALLYDHYLTECQIGLDDLVAEDIGWKEKKVAKYRRALVKAGFLKKNY